MTEVAHHLNEVIQAVITGRIPFSKPIGAMLPSLYLNEAFKGELRSGFNHLELIHGDQLDSHYEEFAHTVRCYNMLPPPLHVLISDPVVPWPVLQNKLNVRLFLTDHAYHHYHHEQFWRHYDFIERTGGEMHLKDFQMIKLNTQAMLMCFYSKKPVEKLKSIFQKTLDAQVLESTYQQFRFNLEYMALLIHYGAYEDVRTLLTSLESIDSSELDPKTSIDFKNVCSLYYYKVKEYRLAMHYLDQAIDEAKRSLSTKDHLHRYLKNNKEKLLRKCENEVVVE